MKNKSWYAIEAREDVAEILIYGDVAEYGVTAKAFRSELMATKAKDIRLRINSRGGSLFDGVAIHAALQEHPATVTAHIDGLAASIASFIPMVADKIIMAKNARMMIHKGSTIAAGNSDDFRKMADTLDDVDTIMIDVYSARSGISKREIKEMMAAETWMNPKQAKEYGFVDEVAGESSVKAQFDLSTFQSVPEDVKALFGKGGSTERDLETLLRDAGVSRSAAKAAIASIKGENQREADDFEDAAKAFLAKLQTSAFATKLQGAFQ